MPVEARLMVLDEVLADLGREIEPPSVLVALRCEARVCGMEPGELLARLSAEDLAELPDSIP